ncbi:MAG: GNAT family N-acetyltransferase [Gammaproteobacteria bacterium]|nr:GNAT family N-acetyltransferase [Gammaproteobacteria bacterium]
MVYRILRKLTAAGIDWRSIVFFMLDMQRKGTALPPESPSDRPSDKLPQHLEYHIIDSIADSWLKVLCDAYPQKQFHLRMIQDCQQCYIVLLGDKLAAYAWVTTSTCRVSEIDLQLQVGPGRLYIYDCFVRADYRGQGIYSALLKKIIADYQLRRWPNRYDTAFIVAESSNTASIRGIRRAGFDEFAQVRYLHMGSFSRWYGVEGLSARMTTVRLSGTRSVLSD